MPGRAAADATAQDPLSSAAEGDADPGSAALASQQPDPGAGPDGEPDAPTFSEVGPPPEAADDTPVTDAVPGTHLEDAGADRSSA